jgi:hypothetical protein
MKPGASWGTGRGATESRINYFPPSEPMNAAGRREIKPVNEMARPFIACTRGVRCEKGGGGGPAQDGIVPYCTPAAFSRSTNETNDRT